MASLFNPPKPPRAPGAVNPGDAANRNLGEQMRRRMATGGSMSTILGTAMSGGGSSPRALLTGLA